MAAEQQHTFSILRSDKGVVQVVMDEKYIHMANSKVIMPDDDDTCKHYQVCIDKQCPGRLNFLMRNNIASHYYCTREHTCVASSIPVIQREARAEMKRRCADLSESPNVVYPQVVQAMRLRSPDAAASFTTQYSMRSALSRAQIRVNWQ